MSDNRGITYVEDGIRIYRASGLGNCIRSLVASRRGLEPRPFPQSVLTAFDEGNKYEAIIIEKYRQAGNEIFSEQAEVSLIISPTIRVRGHIDFCALNEKTGDVRVIDAKALSNDNYNKFVKQGVKAFDHYAWQISIYMHSFGNATEPFLPGGFILLNKETKKLTFVKIDTPPYSKLQIVQRILSIEKAVESEGFPPCEPTSFFCPYNYLHDSPEDKAEVVRSTGHTLDHIPTLGYRVAEYESLKDTEKHVKDRLEKIRKEILEMIPEVNTDFVTRDFTLSVTEYNSDYVPAAKLKELVIEAGIDLEPYLIKSTSQRFNFKRIPKEQPLDDDAN